VLWTAIGKGAVSFRTSCSMASGAFSPSSAAIEFTAQVVRSYVLGSPFRMIAT